MERAADWLHVFYFCISKPNKNRQSGSRWFICTKATMRNLCLLFALLMSIQLASAQRKTVIVETPTSQVQDDGMVLKRKVAIGRFSNETQYAKGIFYDKENDPMGKQALDILSAKLASSGKFILLVMIKK